MLNWRIFIRQLELILDYFLYRPSTSLSRIAGEQDGDGGYRRPSSVCAERYRLAVSVQQRRPQPVHRQMLVGSYERLRSFADGLGYRRRRLRVQPPLLRRRERKRYGQLRTDWPLAVRHLHVSLQQRVRTIWWRHDSRCTDDATARYVWNSLTCASRTFIVKRPIAYWKQNRKLNLLYINNILQIVFSVHNSTRFILKSRVWTQLA